MAYNLQAVLELRDNMSRRLRRATEQVSRMQNTSSRATTAISGMSSAATTAAANVAKVGTAVGAVASATSAAVGKVGIEYNAMMEQSEVAWTTLLGTQEEAQKMLKDISEFTKATPFETEQVDMMAKYMHNAGLEGNALFKELQKASDVASAFAIPASQAKEMVRQMSQVRQAGVAYTEDLNILQDRGVPIYKAIAKEQGIMVKDVKKLASEGKLTADVYTSAFNSIAKGVEGASKDQSKTFNGMMSTLKDNFKILMGQIMEPTFNRLKKVLPIVISGIERMQAAFTNGGWTGVMREFLPPAVANALVTGINTIRTTFDKLKQGVENNRQQITSAMQDVLSKLKPIFDGIVNVVKNVVTVITVLWREWGDEILKIATIAWDTITGVLDNALGIINGVLDTFIGLFTGDWKRMGEGLKSIWSNLWDGIATILKGAWGILKTAFGGLYDSIKSWFTDIIKDAMGWGADIIGGLVNGIKNKLTSAKDAAMEVATGVKDAITNFFTIRSPSRLMREMGQYVTQGLAEGIEKDSDKTTKSAKKVAEKIKKSFDLSMEWISDQKYFNRLSLQDEYEMIDKLYAKYKGNSEHRAKLEKEFYRVKTSINDKLMESNRNYLNSVKEINKEYQDSVKNRSKAISSFAGIFGAPEEREVEGGTLLNNMKKQLEHVKGYSTIMGNLSKRGLTKGMIEEIRKKGPAALAEITALNSMSDKKLNEYVQMWKEKQKIAKEQAVAELSELKDEATKKIASLKEQWLKEVVSIAKGTSGEFDVMGKDLKDIGVNAMKNLMNGIKQMQGAVKATAGSVANSVTSALSPIGKVNTGGEAKETDGSHRHGLSYVPRDGYTAELHRGERVLTAQENRNYSGGGDINISIASMNVRNDSDIDSIARALAREIKVAKEAGV